MPTSRSHHTEPQRLTAESLSRLAEPEKPQLKDWLKRTQINEQIAVGVQTSRSKAKKENFLKKIEKKVEGNTK
ncbi:hypothetical protein MMC28_007876 [Mycoblastus sanguinarius]|nr:hypothetical protein [Mycoblastus sanguinarius]